MSHVKFAAATVRLTPSIHRPSLRTGAFAVGWLFAVLASGSSAVATDAILVEFTSTHCGHCRSMEPVVASLEKSGVAVRRVNVSNETHLVKRYGIRQTPTYLVVAAGKEIARLVGTHSAQELITALRTNPGGPLIATGSQRRTDDPLANGGLADQPFSNATGEAPQTRLVPLRSVAGDRPLRSAIGRSVSPGSSPEAPFGAGGNAAPRVESMPSAITANAVERARAATVRLRVHDGHGFGVGTGTVIDVHGEEALVMTCGHLFRDTDGKGRIEVDLFVAGNVKTVAGQLIDYDAEDRDIAVVAIRPEVPMEPVTMIRQQESVQTGQAVFSFGCDRGDDPSRRDTRITGVNKYNQHLGMSNIEIDGAPIDGRSGGGLFDAEGRLIGVCNAADYKGDVGIYTGPGSIHWQLERVNMAHLTLSADSVAASDTQRLDAPRQSGAPELGPANPLQLAGVNSSFPAASADTQGAAPFDSSSPEPSRSGGGGFSGTGIDDDKEVIVIIRDRNQPAASTKVMTIAQPSRELMQNLLSEVR